MKHIAIDPEVAEVLIEVSAMVGETPEAVTRKALLRYLEDLEDNLAAEEALKDLDRSDTLSSEEVLRELEMDDQLRRKSSKAA